MPRRRLELVMVAVIALTSTVAHAQTSGPPPSQGQAASEPDRPFTRLFQNFFHDARRFPSADTAITLGIGAGLALASHPADDSVTEHAIAGGPKQGFEIGSALGSGWVQVGGAVGVYAAGAISGQRTMTHVGSDLIRVQALNTVLTQGVKFAARRQRPGATSGSSYSFPSGHTSSTFASAAVLWRHFGWKAGVPASAVGVWVASGRVQLEKHFLSDVVFGAALGTAAGRTVTIGHGQRRLALSPAVVPGGGAAVFTLVER